jgi:hypothetical protein
MEVLRHQHPTDEQELQLLPHLLKPLYKAATETVREKNGRPAVSAGGDKLQLTRTVGAMVERHTAEKYKLSIP